MQCLKKLCHDFRHEISIHLIYVDSIFYHNFLSPGRQISCHLYHFYLFAFRFILCALPNGQREPRNVVAYQAIIEPYLGETSKFITAGCSQNAAAFNSYIKLFLYRLAAAGC